MFRRQRSSRAALEAEARVLRGRQGPQGDHSDQSLSGRRPKRQGVGVLSRVRQEGLGVVTRKGKK